MPSGDLVQAAERLYRSSSSLVDVAVPHVEIALRDAGPRRDVEQLVLGALRESGDARLDVAEALLVGAVQGSKSIDQHKGALHAFQQSKRAPLPDSLKELLAIAAHPSLWGDTLAAVRFPDGRGGLTRIVAQVELAPPDRRARRRRPERPPVRIAPRFGLGAEDDEELQAVVDVAVFSALRWLGQNAPEMATELGRVSAIRLFRGGLPWPFERDPYVPTPWEWEQEHVAHRGPSLGLPAALAVLHAFVPHLTSRQGVLCVATGEVREDGSVEAVSDIDVKSQAARAAELPFVFPKRGPAPDTSVNLMRVAATDLNTAALGVFNLLDDSLKSFLSRPEHLFGRERDRKKLHDCWRQAEAGEGGLVLVSGESGIGKSVLTAALVASVRAGGVPVLFTAAHERQTGPVFHQIIRKLVVGLSADTLRDHAYEYGKWISHFVPQLAEFLPEHFGNAGNPTIEQIEENLAPAVAGLIRAAAGVRPLLVVIDDLQWADDSAWLTLGELLGEKKSPVLVVGTYRPAEAKSQLDELTRAKLASHGALEEVALERITQDDMTRWLVKVQRLAPGADERVIRALDEATGGNPFYLNLCMEALSQAAEGDLDLTDAEALIERIKLPTKLDELFFRHKECLRTLDVACVSRTVDFSFPVLVEAFGAAQRDTVVDDLERAGRAGLVRKVTGTTRWRFGHGIIHKALLARLSEDRRAVNNLKVAAAMERIAERAGVMPPVIDVAKHYFAGSVLGEEVGKAVKYLGLAAEHATSSLSYPDSLNWRLQALECLDRVEFSPRQRADVLLRVADAYSHMAQEGPAREYYERGRAVALEGGVGSLLVEATLGLVGPPEDRGLFDEDLVAKMELAVASAGVDPALRARISGRLVFEQVLGARREPGKHPMPDVAGILSAARASGSHLQLAWALSARLLGAWFADDTATVRLALADEMLDAAKASGEDDLAAWAYAFRLIHLLELGQRSAGEATMPDFEACGLQLHHGYGRWAVAVLKCVFAMLDGRLDQALALAAEALAGRSDSFNSYLYKEIQELLIFRELDRHAEKEPVLQYMISQLPVVPGDARSWAVAPLFSAGWALMCCELGRLDEARTVLEQLAADDFADMIRDPSWPTGAALLAEVSVALEDAELAWKLYELLRQRAGECVVVGIAVACLGSVDRYLGMLAFTAGDAGAAERHFQEAIRMNDEGLRSPPWVAHSKHDLAVMLHRRCSDGDLARARNLNLETLSLARDHQMVGLLRKAAALQQVIETQP